MQKLNIELMTGIFVIIGIACFSWLAISIAGTTFSEQPGYALSARFTSISGLREGAVVEGAGVRIGSVTAIEFDPDSFEAIVHLRINEDVQIQEDAIAAVRTQGIIGEKYINIIPGGFEELLTEGMEIYETESAISIEDLVSRYIFSSDG